jgi:amino acid adenylation domain-containing protein
VWLDHGVSEQEGELVLIWSFVDQLFPSGLVDDMFQAYVGLVEALATTEAAWTRPVPALLPARQTAARQVAEATAGPVSDDLLHAGFLRQAAARPDAPAVIAADRCLTYGELRAEAGILAATLRGLGAGPGRLVAVALPKGWEQVVGTLGVLLAGAAYVPLDPEWPEARIDELLAGTGADLCVTLAAPAEGRRWPAGVQGVPVEARGAASGAPQGPETADVGPDALAYVIFTSGSTGTPKGVVIDHRGAVNTILDVNERVGLGAGDRVLALSALTFDLSVWDFFGTLAAGGTIVMPEAAGARDPRHWDALCRQHGVTVWNSVPALLQLLVEEAGRRGAGLPPALRLAMLSGDWIPLDLPRKVAELAPALRMLSLGGATEASIWSIAHPIDRVEPGWTSIPYGRPLRNQTMHVLDGALRPSPDWVPGDLYIGGLGLARGYWGDPERTAAAFLDHPARAARLYRTGDRARVWPGGTIEFLGRRDQQVKVQGFRVELGEVETALARQPGISQAVVTAVGERFEAKRLVAYVVPEDPTLRSPEADARMGAALAEALRALLPAYMVPPVFVVLDALPVSANGKVDRKALPVPGGLLASRRERVAPRTAVETGVAEVWAAVLDQPRVGVHDNFFELGGDSLSAIRLVSRLRESLGVDLPLRRLFDAPTVAGLAEVVEQLRWAGRPPAGDGPPRDEGQV